MQASIPFFRLTSYYLALVVIVYVVVLVFPSAAGYLPFGGNGNLSLDVKEFATGTAVAVDWEPVAKALELFMGLVGVFIFMIPVSWMYMGVRRRRGREQSFVLTLLMLPVAVTGLVIVVENSLALAFSLAGIVAGVRFRYSLDDTLDAIFIFLTIGVGLASGVGALEIAFVLTAFFNYALWALWVMSYAEDTSNNRWFSRTWMNVGVDSDDSDDKNGSGVSAGSSTGD